MEKKILYIRLDSSPLPEACNEMIVKDFNLESYFCALLGRRLLEDTGLGGSMLYPGKLVADFEKANKEAYREIIQQWEKILSTLLISQSENDKDFIVDLPSSYIGWLDRCDIPYAFQIRNYYIHTRSVSIKRKYLFEIVHEVLKNKLDCFLQKNKGIIDRIAFSIDGISRDCYIIHLWKHIITRDYKIITINEFYYKIWEKDKFCIHNVILGETLLEKIRQIHASKDDNAVFWDNIQNPLFSKEWFAALNSSDVVNLYTIKRNRDLPVSLKRIGFDWKMSVALVSGLAAKEVVISTMGVLYSLGGEVDETSSALMETIKNTIPLKVAIGYILFIMIYNPCLAATVVFGKEAGGFKYIVYLFLMTTFVAYIVAYIGTLIAGMLL